MALPVIDALQVQVMPKKPRGAGVWAAVPYTHPTQQQQIPILDHTKLDSYPNNTIVRYTGMVRTKHPYTSSR